jgi:hypothetical protein
LMQAHDPMAWLPTDATTLSDAATAYAGHGLRVLLVWGVRDGRCDCGHVDAGDPAKHALGKHPIAKGWQKSASSDPDVVRDARRAKPNANVGLAMGGAERLIAVDVDGEKGRASWAALEAEHGRAPVTLTSQSGRADGGEHRLYRVSAEHDLRRLKNRSGYKHEGIDIRVDGGQIVAPPSMHASGARYRWSVRAPIAEMPAWLFEALATPLAERREPPSVPASTEPRGSSASTARYLEAVVRNAVRDIASAAEGTRNNVLFAKSCTVFEYHLGEGLDVARVRNLLEDAGRSAGLAEPEVRTAVSQAWEQVKGGPGKPVPLRALPGGAAPSAPTSGTLPAADDSFRLDVDGEGRMRKSLANVVTILGHHPSWAPVLAYNAFTEGPAKLTRPPTRSLDAPAAVTLGDWTDSDSIRTATWIDQEYRANLGTQVVDQAVAVVAERRVVHPVRDWLQGLAWDGTPRLDAWLVIYYGAADTEYVRGVGSRWLMSAVARVFRPGCQADCVLILESPQGAGKSTGLEALFGAEWFSDTMPSLGDKDAYQALRGKWAIEIGELSAIKGREVEKTKGFISARSDSYRPSYARRTRDFPRQCVFVGTTNDSQYLADRTGNRRFWPVRVGVCDRDALRRDRAQIWAEAVARYKAGSPWHADTPAFRALCEAEQAERVQDDPWAQVVGAWLQNPTLEEWDNTAGAMRMRKLDIKKGVLTSEVLIGAMKKTPGQIAKTDEQRAAEALAVCGYERGPQVREGKQRVRRYVLRPPECHQLELVTGVGDRSVTANQPGTTGEVRPVTDGTGETRFPKSYSEETISTALPLINDGGVGDSSSRYLESLKESGVTDFVTDSSGHGDAGDRQADDQSAPRAGGIDALPCPEDAPGEANGELLRCSCMAGPGEAHAGWCEEAVS